MKSALETGSISCRRAIQRVTMNPREQSPGTPLSFFNPGCEAPAEHKPLGLKFQQSAVNVPHSESRRGSKASRRYRSQAFKTTTQQFDQGVLK